jgi:hypothetical protein
VLQPLEQSASWLSLLRTLRCHMHHALNCPHARGTRCKSPNVPLQIHKKLNCTSNWAEQEDAVLVECLNTGLSKWSDIAARIPGRNRKQCRERWFGVLDPNLSQEPWSNAEDTLLQELKVEHGTYLQCTRVCCCVKSRLTTLLHSSTHTRLALFPTING